MTYVYYRSISHALIKEVTWHLNEMVDTAEDRGKCTKRFVQSARKNVKSLSNPEMTVQYIAETVSQNARATAGNK